MIILTKSTKQRIVTKSSTEAELVGASDFASDAMFSKEFLLAQGERVKDTIICQDNQSTIALLHNGGSSSTTTRHINICYFWMKDRIDAVVYVPTDDMIADILFKPLQGSKFLQLHSQLFNWKI